MRKVTQFLGFGLFLAAITWSSNNIDAAEKHPSPPAFAVPAGEKGIIKVNTITITRNADNTIKVIIKGSYNYDDDFDFDKILVKFVDDSGDEIEGTHIFTNEASIVGKPNFTVTFDPVADIAPDFNIKGFVILSLKDPNEPTTDPTYIPSNDKTAVIPARVQVQSDEDTSF